MLSSYQHVVYTTASHEPTAPRWRAIVALSRAVTVDEYALVQAHAARLLATRGIVVDRNAKDACRLWYAPTVRPDGVFDLHAGDGAPLDVEAACAHARAYAAAMRTRPASLASVSARRSSNYAAAALRSAAHRVAGAPDGTRNATLNREAYGVARLAIDPAAIETVLLDAAISAGLTEHEARRTITSALRARRGST